MTKHNFLDLTLPFTTNKCLHCSNCVKCDIYYDPIFYLIFSLLGGILFSGVSWGIVYYIAFLIFWELMYWIYSGYQNSVLWDPALRVGVLFGALLGFIIGRTFHNEADHSKDYKNFKKDLNYCFEDC